MFDVFSGDERSPSNIKDAATPSGRHVVNNANSESSGVVIATKNARVLIAPADEVTRTPEEEGTTLKGRVYDAATGQALGGAVVEIYQAPRSGGLAPNRTAHTDEDGCFTFRAVREDEMRLVARAARYRRHVVRISSLREDVVLELEPFVGVLEGRVIASEGWPLAGAFVRARGGEPPFEQVVTTDNGGAYRLERIPGAGAVVHASAPGRQTAACELAQGEPGATRTLDIHLPPGRSLGAVEVTDMDGNAIEGASVRFGDADERELAWIDVGFTDENGRARLVGLPLQACTLSVRAEGFLDVRYPLASSTAEEVWESERLLQVVLPSCGFLFGELVNFEGDPIQGRLLFRRVSRPPAKWKHLEGPWVTRTTWSEAMGRFRVGHLLPDTSYSLVIDAPGHAPTVVDREFTISPGGELNLGTIQLQRGRSLLGQVSVEPDITASSVRLGALGILPSGGKMTWRDVRVSADGSFELLAMPLGEFTLRGQLGELERDVIVHPGQVSVDVDMREVELPWTLKIRCVDLLGMPCEGVPLVARRPGKEASDPLTPSGEAGLYELGGIVGPIRLVSLDVNDEFVALDPETRLARSEASATLCVERKASLKGRVVESESGRAILGAEVTWRHTPAEVASNGGHEKTQVIRVGVDPTGAFLLVVPAQRFGELTASAAGFLSATRSLSPPGMANDRWDVALTRAGHLVVEVLSGPDAPIKGALVRCIGPDEHSSNGHPTELRTDTLGRAVFDFEQDGTYRIVLMFGSTVEERSVEGAVGGDIRVIFDSVPPGTDLSVRVQDADGTPAQHRSVILADFHEIRSAQTDAGGIVRFEGIPPGEYRLRVRPPGGAVPQGQLVRVPTGIESYDIVFYLE